MSRPDERIHVTTRRATEADHEFVFQLRKAALGTYIEATWGWDDAYQRALHDRRFAEQPMDVLLVGEERIGSLLVERTDEEIVLVSIYLLPAWQSRGIGSRILASLAKEADARKIPIRLKVLRVNERAVALYERFGFVVIDTTATHHGMRRP